MDWKGMQAQIRADWRRAVVQVLLLLALAVLLLWPRPAWAGTTPDGVALFANHCAGCHVNGGNVLRRSKTLKLTALQRQGLASPDAIARVAAQGVGQMSGYAAVLGEGGPEAVAAYVWQQAQAGWPRR